MYKITLYDDCNSPIIDGAEIFFVENLKEFEINWIPLQAKVKVDPIERYYKSKFGEIVTDFNTKDEKFNIVQKVTSKEIDSKEFIYENKVVSIENAYKWESKIEFDHLSINLKLVEIDNEFLLLGQYKGLGCKRISNTYNRWYEKEVKYSQMHFYGNRIANYQRRDVNWDDIGKDDSYKDFYTNDGSFFKNEKIETFVWLPIKKVYKNYKITELTKEEISLLMRDIVGDAG